MKANFRTSFAKRSLVIAATALPSLYSGLANAQAPAPATPPTVPAAPAAPAGSLPAPIAGDSSPTAGAPIAAPVIVPQAPAMPPAAPMVAPAEAPPPVDPMAEKYKHISMGVWSRTGFAFQNGRNPKKLNGVGMGGEAEIHFSNQMRKGLAWTANFAATYGAPDGGSFLIAGDGGPQITGSLQVQDLIAQFEPDPAFNIWVGRMLVASDRSNFSGPYFMAPWIYPLKLGPQGFANAFAVVGPKEGPYGRNDGATVWGQVNGGLFKYYLGAYNMFDSNVKPLISGRVAISLLSPEPGFYGSSTYYGKDLLAIGLGGQYQKNGDSSIKPGAGGVATDYGMFLADILFEKDLKESGIFDAEGAFYKYVGDGEGLNFSYMGLVSYVTPETGVGKFQPLVRIQQAKQKDVADGGGGNSVTMVDGQVNYLIDSYSTRLALGVSHASNGDGLSSNSIFAGVQLQK